MKLGYYEINYSIHKEMALPKLDGEMKREREGERESERERMTANWRDKRQR